jgi:hypothetical protein
MKSVGQTVIFAAIIFVNLVLAAQSQPVNDHGPAAPLLVIDHVPISAVITNLGRQADINLIIDKRLSDWWTMKDNFGRELQHEPIVDIRWTNITARAALLRLLQEHHLTLLDDPVTSIARVTYPGQTLPHIDTSLFGNATNVIPLIWFEDVPQSIAWENLAKQAGMNYILDPRITGLPDQNGRIKPEPVLSFRWENLTARQALIALYENGDWTISRDPASSITLIRAKNHPANFVDVTLFENVTNPTPGPGTIPLIEFQDVPLSVALENLAKQMNFKCTLDPQMDDPPFGGFRPEVSCRWENVTCKEAFISTCENYDLVIVKDPATGTVEVKSDD